jgi:phage terminase large subunit GpA-like protein
MENNDVYLKSIRKGLEPDPIMTVSEWADQYRVLPQKVAAEPGPWRTSRVPYLREIMDSLSVTDPIEEVVLIKGAQLGGTEAGNNWLGYIIDYAPGPTMAVMPTVELQKRNSRQRIDTLIESCDRIKGKVNEKRSRDGGNTMLLKEFTGGLLVLTGANSAVGLRSLPARNLFLDEIDAYPFDVDGEGDPISLAKARSRTFHSKKKVLKVSTPTIAGRSKIESSYENTDQRKYFVPCPICGRKQVLDFKRLKWKKSADVKYPTEVWYECEFCDGRIEEKYKTEMLAGGEWKPTNTAPHDTGARGFHLSSLYSPLGWYTWQEIVKDFIDSKDDPELLRGFVNTVLGETWKDKGEAPEHKRLYERRDTYKTNSIPDGVVFLTAGVDVQKDRIEVEVVGWGRGKRSWSIDYRVFLGPTDTLSGKPWKELSELVHETWDRNGIAVPLKRMAVDSGYNTQTVYSWVRKYHVTQAVAVKGVDTLAVMVGVPKSVDITQHGKKRRSGVKLFPVGVNIIKTETYGYLRLDSASEGEPDPLGYCRFPQYEEDYFKQLTAEEKVSKIVKGFRRYEWVKVRDRNEALDCRVYARAAASLVGLDLFKEENWIALENGIGASFNEKTDAKRTGKGKQVTIQRRKSTFL